MKAIEYEDLSMKNISLCLLFLGTSLLTTWAASEVSSENPCSLVLSVSTNRFEPMTPVLLTAVLRNNAASNAVYIGGRVKLLDCKLIVKDRNGQEMPPTRYQEWLHGMDKTAGTAVITIEPGKSRIFKIPVNLLYDMTVPGSYKITASIPATWNVPGEKKTLQIESDPIEIVVQNLRPE